VDEMVVSRNPDGTPREFFGIMQDITKRKEEEVELQNQKLMLSTIFENSPYPMILIDSN
jgi:PAS domain-containing protein